MILFSGSTPKKYDSFESYTYKIDLAQETNINFIYMISIDINQCVYLQRLTALFFLLFLEKNLFLQIRTCLVYS